MTDQSQKPSIISDLLEPCGRMRRYHLEEKVILLHRIQDSQDPDLMKVVEEAFSKPLRQIWADTAQDVPGNSIEDLMAVLWRSNEHLFDFVIQPIKDGVQVHVTRCLFYEVSKQLNATMWGDQLFCSDYQHIVHTFNPNIAFYRPNTLMRGHPYCDFYFFLKESGER
ncbi:MAG: L-2-amino-thiazoline-4-carboxylic acid hydrolase [Anaerolineae bacterium]|nr:L-2-amino-thiazoline-4-carboxylic acid hydrolase [Anaerolineae bacterium]